MPAILSTSPDFNTNLAAAINGGRVVEVDAASGAIAVKEGTVVITKSSGAAVMTLALPVAGAQTAGGDDGKVLRIVSTTAQAHTVTTPATGYNGATHIATFAANIGSAFELVAYNGSWYMLNTIGITLT